LGSSKKAVALPSLAKKGYTAGGEGGDGREEIGDKENVAGSVGRGVGENMTPAAYA
jgi:hypothetical protein